MFTFLQLLVINKCRCGYFYNWQLENKIGRGKYPEEGQVYPPSESVISISYKEEGSLSQSSNSFALTILISGIVKA